MDVFGAKAAIHIGYTGDLPSLATKLAMGLILPEFNIGEREDPPHDLMGSMEVLGCELWLERKETDPRFPYSLTLETEHALEESFHGKMHDLSPWLARYVSAMCDLDVLVSGTRTVFVQGRPQEWSP